MPLVHKKMNNKKSGSCKIKIKQEFQFENIIVHQLMNINGVPAEINVTLKTRNCCFKIKKINLKMFIAKVTF